MICSLNYPCEHLHIDLHTYIKASPLSCILAAIVAGSVQTRGGGGGEGEETETIAPPL